MDYTNGFDVAGVIDRLATPLIQKELPGILYRNIGNGWYHDYVKGIMKKYPDYAMLTEGKEEPISSYDITAIWYLLFPYEVVNEEYVQLEGAGTYFQKEKGLTDDQMKKLESLRTLRNRLVHGNVLMRFIKPDHQGLFHVEEQEKEVDGEIRKVKIVIYDGKDPLQAQLIVHEDALDFIEEAFRPLNPGVSKVVQDKKKQIITELTSSEELVSSPGSFREVYQPNYSKYLGVIQEARKQYQGISHSDWSRSPISQPIELPLPWVNLLRDLDDLPWPSDEELADVKVAEETPLFADAEEENPTIVAKAVDKVMSEAVDMGKSLFKNLFGKK